MTPRKVPTVSRLTHRLPRPAAPSNARNGGRRQVRPGRDLGSRRSQRA